ncbi:MAG: hypothetical protein EOO24_17735 [Comamonadaceae bacterium]|nr:MAG: hypothetical protein EOO24_17735 [Comamonadaceae bacterium]
MTFLQTLMAVLTALGILGALAVGVLALRRADRFEGRIDAHEGVQRAIQERDLALREHDQRLRLFDLRFRALQAIETELRTLAKSGVDEQRLNAFEAAIAPVPYLFDEAIHDFLNTNVRMLLERRLSAHKEFSKNQRTPTSSKERLVELGVNLNESVGALWNAAARVRALCAPYLQLPLPVRAVPGCVSTGSDSRS